MANLKNTEFKSSPINPQILEQITLLRHEALMKGRPPFPTDGPDQIIDEGETNKISSFSIKPNEFIQYQSSNFVNYLVDDELEDESVI